MPFSDKAKRLQRVRHAVVLLEVAGRKQPRPQWKSLSIGISRRIDDIRNHHDVVSELRKNLAQVPRGYHDPVCQPQPGSYEYTPIPEMILGFAAVIVQD